MNIPPLDIPDTWTWSVSTQNLTQMSLIIIIIINITDLTHQVLLFSPAHHVL